MLKEACHCVDFTSVELINLVLAMLAACGSGWLSVGMAVHHFGPK